MTPGFSHRDKAARNAEPDDAGFHQLHGAGGPSSPGLPGASATGAVFTSRVGFFVFRATPTATATGTAAEKAYFSFFLRGVGRFEGTTAASCERSIGLPIFISVRSYANCLCILRLLPLERPRGGSQEKTAASSVSERHETADSEYCRSPQSPRRTRTQIPFWQNGIQ